MFDFSEYEVDLVEVVSGYLRNGLLPEIQPYLVGDKLRGSVRFDQAEAVLITLHHDIKSRGELSKRLESGAINHLAIWKTIDLALKRDGHNMKKGVLALT